MASSPDSEQQKVVRPFSSGPIWEKKKTKIDEDVQIQDISSSTTNFAITLGTGKKIQRETGPVVKCSFSSIEKRNGISIIYSGSNFFMSSELLKCFRNTTLK